jgi:hypothetical protein
MSSPDHNIALTTCSKCSERYAAAARFCSHCGADNLGGDNDATEAANLAVDMHYDLFLLGIPVAGTLATWLWVANQSLSEAPWHSLWLILLLNVLGTAAAACLESRVFSSRRHGSHHFDPPVWFALIALLWVFAYPLYLYRRKGYGTSNLLAAGVMLTLLFSGSIAVVGYRIDQRQQALQALQSKEAHAEAIAHTVQDPDIYDAIAAYQQARKYNSPLEICIKAKQVVALLRDANDLERFRTWDATKRTDCHAAGLLEQ